MRAGVHVYPGLCFGIVGMSNRNGAGGLLIAAGDRDGGLALGNSGHLAGAVNCCDCGLVARPMQVALCVDRLLDGGELTGLIRIKIQIYLRRGNGNTGKRNRGSLGHGDVEDGRRRKRFNRGAIDGNQLQSGACRSGVRLYRLDLAVLQRNVFITLRIRSAAADLDNAPFRLIAAALGQQSRKLGRKLRRVVYAQGNILVCVNILKSQSIGRIIVYNHIPCAVEAFRGTGVTGNQRCSALRNAGDLDGMVGERCGILAACGNFGIVDSNATCCRAALLEGDLVPIIDVAGVCAELQRNALTLLDIDLSIAAVAFQQHAIQRNIVIQLDAVFAHNRACRMGVSLLETGENIIGGIARQTGYGIGSDLICAPIRRIGRAVNILAVGVEVRDFEAGVVFAILHGLQLNNLGITVVGGLADLHRRADDFAEIALRCDLHADADSITHVSRHGSILATGRALNIRPCAAAVRAALPLVRRGGFCGGHAGRDGDGAVVDNAAGVVHAALDGGIGYNHRRFAHHQLDDMLVAHDADVVGAAGLFQIQMQGKGIDLGGSVLINGEAIFGVGGADGISGGRGRTGDIAVARCVIAVACGTQLLRQRIPLEFKGMCRAVVHLLDCAIPVLGVVDFGAVQRDGLHAPCVGDDSDGVGSSALQPHFIIIITCLFQNSSVSIGTGKGAVRRNNCAVAKALVQSQRNIGVAFRFLINGYIIYCVKVYCALKGAAIQTVRHIKAFLPIPVLQINIVLKGAAVHCNSRIRIILLCYIQRLHTLLEGASVDLNRTIGVLISNQPYPAVEDTAVNDNMAYFISIIKFSFLFTKCVSVTFKSTAAPTILIMLRLADGHTIFDRNITL